MTVSSDIAHSSEIQAKCGDEFEIAQGHDWRLTGAARHDKARAALERQQGRLGGSAQRILDPSRADVRGYPEEKFEKTRDKQLISS
jgi:hypothetical protein